MAREPKLYTKLPGRGLRRSAFAVSATRTRLWLGPDHLLAVDSTVASEEYRRFYFRDIEAFVIRRTSQRLVLNLVFAILVLLTSGPFLYFSLGNEGTPDERGIFLGFAVGFAVFWLVFLLVNSLRGPTCETHIRTAVQLEKLPSLARLRTVGKVLARVRPLIEATQGVVSSEELQQANWVADAPKVERLQRKSPALHYGLFSALPVNAVLTALYALQGEQASVLVSSLAGSASLLAFILAILALMRQRGMILAKVPRTLPKVAVGIYVVWLAVGSVFMIKHVFSHTLQPVISGREAMSEPGFAAFSFVASAVAALLGVTGLLTLRASQRAPVQ